MKEQELYTLWAKQLKGDPAYSKELDSIKDNPEEIRDRFYRDLSFGTAGLRGVLGLGTNRMNVFTVRRATQGLAEYLLASCKAPSAAIAYDSRINSHLFAREAASVFAANGIKVHLYSELMPTPALSYAVRELHCDTGVVVTASHNPAKYNGYKAYGPDGCQIGPETADQVLAAMERTDLFNGPKYIPFEEGLASGMIAYIPESFVEQYISRVMEEAIQPEVCKKAGLRLVYTPLNGAGRRCVTTVLDRLQVKDIHIVKEQEQPDGNFPTCPYPNPETKEALELGLKLCEKTGADMLLATDPDADRVAVAVRAGEAYKILSGNEVGILLMDYIASQRAVRGTLPKHPVAVKSIVSSPMADCVAKSHGVEMRNVLTGFKWIGEVIAGLEEQGEADRFIFAFEESCGYLSGGYVRDKDAVDASLLLVEMASHYKLAGKTLADVLEDLYRQHGVYRSVVESFAFEGADGMGKMKEIMEGIRANPPREIGGAPVVFQVDYQTSLRTGEGMAATVELPPSNVLEFGLEGGSTIIVRPSGTEPKIKIYYTLVAKTHEEAAALSKAYSAACKKLVPTG